jgi:hypothetical protein
MLQIKNHAWNKKNLYLDRAFRIKISCVLRFFLKLRDVNGIYPRLMKYFYEVKVK